MMVTIGVARILIGGGQNHKLHAMTSSQIFKTGTFFGQKYRRMEDPKPCLLLTINQDFAKGRGNLIVKRCNCLTWRRVE